jgi:hypothetical protein
VKKWRGRSLSVSQAPRLVTEPDVEIKRIEDVIALARYQSFSRAAEVRKATHSETFIR